MDDRPDLSGPCCVCGAATPAHRVVGKDMDIEWRCLRAECQPAAQCAAAVTRGGSEGRCYRSAVDGSFCRRHALKAAEGGIPMAVVGLGDPQ